MAKRKDQQYKWNPSLTLVGYVLKQGKEHIRTRGHRIGRIGDKLEHIVTEEKKVIIKDTSDYVKFYLDSESIYELIELSLSAQRILAYVIKKLEYNKDTFYLSIDEVVEKVEMDKSSVHKALRELLDREWFYLTTYTNMYFINICFVCKGIREEMYDKYIAATK